MWKPQWKFKQQPLTQKKKHIFLVDFNINGHSIKNAELPFLCFRYNGYCLYHLFKNNIYMLKVDITVCFKINFHSIYISSFLSYIFRSQSLSLSHSLTYSFSLLLIHSLTLIYPLWHPLFRKYTVHLSFIPKYLQVKKKEKKKQLTTDSNALWTTELTSNTRLIFKSEIRSKVTREQGAI